jgi:sugar/nucleoside kinase (ribokinase family)
VTAGDGGGATPTGVPGYAILGCLTMDSVVSASGDLIHRTCGGNALWAAVGAHIWDHRVGIVARAGIDYPAECLGKIAEAVDLRGLRRLAGQHPIHVAFAYRPDGSRSRRIPDELLATIPEDFRADFIDDTHDDARYLSGTPTPDDIPPAWLTGVEATHLPALLVESHRELITALRRGRPSRLITVDSPWYERRNTTSEAHVDILREIDAVLPSEDDLMLFRPDVTLVEAARELIAYGARAVVVKLGSAGSIVLDGSGEMTHVPAYPARTVDPTGAGDSFCGGFLVGLRETHDLIQATLYGTVAASFVVEDRHAIPVFRVRRSAAEERLAAISGRVRQGITGDPRRTHA